jgi:hypothetical protein
MYAILIHKNYDVLNICDNYQDALDIKSRLLEHEPELYIQIVDTDKSSHLKVTYTELGGPWGYGHQEVSFETYGGIRECLIHLVNWVKETERVFGPDWRDIRDYFRRCSLSINGQNKTDWFKRVYVDKIPHIYFA